MPPSLGQRDSSNVFQFYLVYFRDIFSLSAFSLIDSVLIPWLTIIFKVNRIISTFHLLSFTFSEPRGIDSSYCCGELFRLLHTTMIGGLMSFDLIFFFFFIYIYIYIYIYVYVCVYTLYICPFP